MTSEDECLYLVLARELLLPDAEWEQVQNNNLNSLAVNHQ